MSIATARLTGVRPRPFGYRPRREPLWSSREAFFSDAALFILGAAGLYSANFIGSLPGCEILLFPMLPVMLLARGKRAFDRRYLWFYVLTLGWLIGTLIADEYNGIAAFNRAKGTARVVFFILDFMALAIFINNRARKIIVFALSISALYLIGSWQFSEDLMLQWKFGLSQGLSILALLISSYYFKRRRYRVCLSISLLLAGVNLRYGFRSQLVIIFVSAVLTLPLFDTARTRASAAADNRNTFRVLILLALAGGAAYAANAAINYGARRGIFDESTNSKFVTQSEGDYGVLVGGRPETLVAIQAIRDSPILGHGSFPFGLKYMQMKQDIQYEHGYSDTDEPEEVDYPVIPTHSHLTMAWVEGGILGGICWVCIFILVLRSVLRLTALRPHLAPLYSYLLINFLWDILYSPFGSVNRMRAAFYILMSYSILRASSAKTVGVRNPIVKKIDKGPKTVRLTGVATSSPRSNIPGGRPLERPGQA
jgi:O-antigen ligase